MSVYTFPQGEDKIRLRFIARTKSMYIFEDQHGEGWEMPIERFWVTDNAIRAAAQKWQQLIDQEAAA